MPSLFWTQTLVKVMSPRTITCTVLCLYWKKQDNGSFIGQPGNKRYCSVTSRGIYKVSTASELDSSVHRKQCCLACCACYEILWSPGCTLQLAKGAASAAASLISLSTGDSWKFPFCKMEIVSVDLPWQWPFFPAGSKSPCNRTWAFAGSWAEVTQTPERGGAQHWNCSL